MPNMTNTENEAILELQRVRNYKQFVCTDNRLQCYNESDDFDNAIVQQITAAHQQKSTHNGSDKVDTPRQVTRTPGNLLLKYYATSIYC
jgi:hypothetical protein